MFRTALLVVALLVVSVPSASAIGLEGAGVRGGLNFAFTSFEFEGEDRLDNDSTTGALFGGFVELEWSRRSPFHVVLEANYVVKGYQGRRNLPSDPEPIDVDVAANYLSVPVLGRVFFNDDDDFKLYAVVGPSVEILLSHDDDTLLDDFAGWSLAGNVGIGLEFLVADPLAVQFDFRFNTDFTDSYDGGDAEGVGEIRQQGISATAGLRF